MLTLETDRLRLRPLHHGDADAVAAMLGDWAVSRMLFDVPHPCPPNTARHWVRRGLDEQAYAVELAGEVIGAVTYFDDGPRSAEIGFIIRRDRWGQGFAAEAARRVIDHAFAADGIDEFRSRHVVDNARSRRVLERLGFTEIGRETSFLASRGQAVEVATYRLPREAAVAAASAGRRRRHRPPVTRPLRRLAWRLRLR